MHGVLSKTLGFHQQINVFSGLFSYVALQWRHIESHDFFNQRLLIDSLFKLITKKTPEHRITGPLHSTSDRWIPLTKNLYTKSMPKPRLSCYAVIRTHVGFKAAISIINISSCKTQYIESHLSVYNVNKISYYCGEQTYPSGRRVDGYPPAHDVTLESAFP